MKSRNAIIGNVKVKNGVVYKKIDNQDDFNLFDYLKSCNFDNIPAYQIKDRYLTYPFIDDFSINNDLKAKELIKVIATLHNKTIYTKNIDLEKINNLKDKYLNHLNYYLNYFNNYFNENISKEFYKPSTYLILRNYSFIINYINNAIKEVNSWYDAIKSRGRVRLSVIHNNLSLNHLIINNNNYLISWDHHKNDFPIIDLIVFYRNYFNDLNFEDLFKEYLQIFPLEDDEITLFKVLLYLNFSYERQDNELSQLKNNTIFMLYLTKTMELIKVL